MAYKINNLQEYQAEYAASVKDPEAFWAKQADRFQWKKK